MEDDKGKHFIFVGFQSPNFTPVPDQFFDELVDVLSNAETKVLLYIIRRTFGFKKNSDNISFSQLCNGITTKEGQVLDRGTGLSKSSVALAIKSLAEKKIIIVKRNKSFERGFEATTYALHVIGAPLYENRTRVVPKIGQGLVRKSDIQETVLQDIKRNVNVRLIKKEKKRSTDNNDKFDSDTNLLYQIIDYTGDKNPQSEGSFRKIIRGLGKGTTDQIMTITKDAVRSGTVSKNRRARYFMGVAKRIAEDRGINLGFKNGAFKTKIIDANLKAQIGNTGRVRKLKSGSDEAE